MSMFELNNHYFCDNSKTTSSSPTKFYMRTLLAIFPLYAAPNIEIERRFSAETFVRP